MNTVVVASGLLVVCVLVVVVIAYEAARAPNRRAASSNGQVAPRIPAVLVSYTAVVVGTAVAVAAALLGPEAETWVAPLIGGVVGVVTLAVTRWWDEAHGTDFVRLLEETLK